jgi:hypothetical protein
MRRGVLRILKHLRTEVFVGSADRRRDIRAAKWCGWHSAYFRRRHLGRLPPGSWLLHRKIPAEIKSDYGIQIDGFPNYMEENLTTSKTMSLRSS